MAGTVRSSAADRRRPTLWDGGVALLILAAALVLLWLLRPVPADRLTAEVRMDGALLGAYDLSALGGRTETVELDAPYPMTLELRSDGVRVAHSDCPSQDCVHTGWIGRAGEQIVCLPNKCIISLTGGADASAKDFDVVAG